MKAFGASGIAELQNRLKPSGVASIFSSVGRSQAGLAMPQWVIRCLSTVLSIFTDSSVLTGIQMESW